MVSFIFSEREQTNERTRARLEQRRSTVNPAVASTLDSGQEEQAVEISVGVRRGERETKTK